MFQRFWRWVLRFARKQRVSNVITVNSRSEVPDKLGDALVLVGSSGHYKWALLECPCRCGDLIEVNLMQSRRPFWTVALARENATLHPSLWRPHGTCGSHFVVRANQIIWCD